MPADISRLAENDYLGHSSFCGLRNGSVLAFAIWLILAACLLAVRANAAGCGNITLPPPQYDHLPSIPFRVQNVTFGSTDRVCAENGVGSRAPLAESANYRVLACSWHGTLGGLCGSAEHYGFLSSLFGAMVRAASSRICFTSASILSAK